MAQSWQEMSEVEKGMLRRKMMETLLDLFAEQNGSIITVDFEEENEDGLTRWKTYTTKTKMHN